MFFTLVTFCFHAVIYAAKLVYGDSVVDCNVLVKELQL